MEFNLYNSQQVATLAFVGRFDWAAESIFAEAQRSVLAEHCLNGLRLDFSAVDYIDSTGLGFLLLLRANVKKVHGAAVKIVSPLPPVRKVLEIANYDKLFRIE